jgi:predicted nucleotidyltransferase
VQAELRKALRQAIASLEKHNLRYAVIGGIALQLWGKPRFTYDVDIKVLVPDTDYSAARAKIRAAFPKRARPHAPPNPLIVDAQVGDITVDFLLALPGYEENIITRAVRRRMGNLALWICSAEDLIIQKVVANRPKDWQDIEGILAEQHGRLDYDYIENWLQQFADALEQPKILRQYHDIRKRIDAILVQHGESSG